MYRLRFHSLCVPTKKVAHIKVQNDLLLFQRFQHMHYEPFKCYNYLFPGNYITPPPLKLCTLGLI